MIIHERNYSIDVYQTDIRGELTLVSLFDLFQDIAGRHASVLGFGREHLMVNHNFWVLSRISVIIDRMPLHWNDVLLRTWPRGTDGIFAVRDFEMFSAEGEKLVVASSSWVVVDYETRRLQRPDRALSVLNQQFPDRKVMDQNAIKVNNIPEAGRTTCDHQITQSEIDINRHANNAMYIKWIYDTYTPDFIDAYIPERIDVNYITEGHCDEIVSVITTPDPSCEGSFIHSVIKKENETEMCRVRLKWRKNNMENLY